MEAGRFLIPLVPFLLVGLTEGLAGTMGRIGIQRSRSWASALILGISLPYSTYAILNGRAEAQRRLHADFDAACQWISLHSARPGPVLTRHPGEVYWQTGRPAVEPDSVDPEAVHELIDHLAVVYLLIDENRYANAAVSPLEHYVERFPRLVTLVWESNHGGVSVRVFETQRVK